MPHALSHSKLAIEFVSIIFSSKIFQTLFQGSLATLLSLASVSSSADTNYCSAPGEIEIRTYGDQKHTPIPHFIDADAACIAAAGNLYGKTDFGYLNAKYFVDPVYGTGCSYDFYSGGINQGPTHAQGWVLPDHNCFADIKQAGAQCLATSNPIAISSGNKYLVESDVANSLLNFERTYNKNRAVGQLNLSAGSNGLIYSALGSGWSFSYAQKLIVPAYDITETLNALRPSGRIFTYKLSAGAWRTDADVTDTLTELKDSSNNRTGWKYIDAAQNTVEVYDINGKLLKITAQDGTVKTLIYSDGTDGTSSGKGGFVLDASGSPTTTVLPAGLLLRVEDNSGRTLQFGYNAANQIVRVITPSGDAIQYAFDSNNNLSSVIYPDGKQKTYLYNEPGYTSGANLPNALTGILDETSTRYASYFYDTQGRAIDEKLAGDVDRYQLSFSGTSTNVTDPIGSTRTYNFTNILGVLKPTGVSQPGGSGCAAASSNITYDANGNANSRTDFNGNKICYTNDLSRNLETVRVEGYASGDACPSNLTTATPPSGGRKTSTQWHPVWRMPVRRAEPTKITTWVYNGQPDPTNGNTILTCAPSTALVDTGVPIAVLCKQVEQPTTDGAGTNGFSATSTGTARIWTYTYDSYGNALTVNGPRTDVTDITTNVHWSPTATCPGTGTGMDKGCRGKLYTSTNALGQVTKFQYYNAHGQPLSMQDANGITSVFVYDERQRLKKISIQSQETTFTYKAWGDIEKITQPDGSNVTFTYDAAHRITDITDNLGNSIHYSLDNLGNVLTEDIKNPSGTIIRSLTRSYDALGRMQQVRNMQLEYDANGNPTKTTNGLGYTTQDVYDRLDRILQHNRPPLAVGQPPVQTKFAYNGQDDLIQIKDPRNIATNYTPDSFGNDKLETSLDRGSTTRTFDSAGNLLTSKDAKNQTTTYEYDALNRLTKTTFADGSYNTYGYDTFSTTAPTNYGKGRLTRISEYNSAGTSLAYVLWRYDELGQVVEDTRAINGKMFVTAYAYAPYGSGSATGKITKITYPSGREVNYFYDSLGQISGINTVAPTIVSGTAGGSQTLAYSIKYQPFQTGSYAISNFFFGSGELYIRGQDNLGRITSFTLGQLSGSQNKFNLTLDGADHPKKIDQNGSTTNLATFDYDTNDRLTNNVLPGLNISYGYDLNGNRTTLSRGSSNTSFTIDSTSNKVTQTNANGTVKTIVTDANGSITDDGTNTYTFNAKGRMATSTSSVGTTTYYVNAMGQRMRKTNASTGDYVYIYGLDGSLLGEYPINGSATTQPIRETVYLYDMPTAHFIENPTGSPLGSTRSGEVFFVHNDHLNTPRLLTDKAKNPRWLWSPIAVEAFGNDVANEQPTAGQIIVKFDLRFPGQVYTKETGLFYNYFRDGYNSAWGRYEQFDPIGMFGGSASPYAYSNNGPTMYTDPLGLAFTGATIGGRIGQWAGGTVGAAVGEAINPAGGGIPGALFGARLGKVLGAAAGSAIEDICRPEDDCTQIQSDINARVAELKTRYNEALADKMNLFRDKPIGKMSWESHIGQYEAKQRNLAKLIAQAKRKNCPYNPEADEFVTKPFPYAPTRYMNGM